VQLEQLKNLECESGQGYLFSEPLTFEQVRAFLRKETYEIPASHIDDATTISVLQ